MISPFSVWPCRNEGKFSLHYLRSVIHSNGFSRSFGGKRLRKIVRLFQIPRRARTRFILYWMSMKKRGGSWYDKAFYTTRCWVRLSLHRVTECFIIIIYNGEHWNLMLQRNNSDNLWKYTPTGIIGGNCIAHRMDQDSLYKTSSLRSGIWYVWLRWCIVPLEIKSSLVDASSPIVEALSRGACPSTTTYAHDWTKENSPHRNFRINQLDILISQVTRGKISKCSKLVG